MFSRTIGALILLGAVGCAPRLARTHYERWAQQEQTASKEKVVERTTVAPTPAPAAAPAVVTEETPRVVTRPADAPKEEEKKESEDFVY